MMTTNHFTPPTATARNSFTQAAPWRRRFPWKLTVVATAAILIVGIVVGAFYAGHNAGLNEATSRPSIFGRALGAPVYTNGDRTSPSITNGQRAYVTPINASSSKVEKGAPTSDFTVTATSEYAKDTGISGPVTISVVGPEGTNPEIDGIIVWTQSDAPTRGSIMGISYAGASAAQVVIRDGYRAGTTFQVVIHNR